jgi:hypothetical protein
VALIPTLFTLRSGYEESYAKISGLDGVQSDKTILSPKMSPKSEDELEYQHGTNKSAREQYGRMIHSLANLALGSQVLSKKEHDLFLKSLLAGLRPGVGLIGNEAEEEALYNRGMKVQLVIMVI